MFLNDQTADLEKWQKNSKSNISSEYGCGSRGTPGESTWAEHKPHNTSGWRLEHAGGIQVAPSGLPGPPNPYSNDILDFEFFCHFSRSSVYSFKNMVMYIMCTKSDLFLLPAPKSDFGRYPGCMSRCEGWDGIWRTTKLQDTQTCCSDVGTLLLHPWMTLRQLGQFRNPTLGLVTKIIVKQITFGAHDYIW